MPRKAKSAIIQLMEQNPNRKTKEELHKRAKNEEKLNFGTDKLVPPNWLKSDARKIFLAIVDMYKDTSFLNNADLVTLTQYCDWYGEYLACNKRLSHGRSHDGKPSPELRMKLQISGELDRLARELGLTPAARSSLAIHLADDDQGKTKEDDEFDE